jgi:hypothetical protein
MANTETTKSRKGGSGSSFIPLAVALVTVGLFLGWLATRPAEETVAVQEPNAADDTAAPVDPEGPATTVEAATLAGAAGAQYVGQNIALDRAEVLSPMGSRLFWIDAGGQPYLVYLAEGALPAAGQNVRITGVVREKDEAQLDQWEQAGVLESEGHRLQAEFGTTYIEARRVAPAG